MTFDDLKEGAVSPAAFVLLVVLEIDSKVVSMRLFSQGKNGR
jgi:hypothetical protein